MPNSNTRKLNDTQLVILSSASQREDGFAVLPEGVRAASLKAAVIRLTKLGFLRQVRVKRDQPHWSSDEQGRRIGLKITDAGSAAIGVGDDCKGEEQPAPEPKRRSKKVAEPGLAQRETGAPHGRSKRAQIIALMQGVTGATLDDMVEATGLAPAHHTRRADGPAPQGLCNRQRQERQGRDGVPDRRCGGRGHVDPRRRGARVMARINGQAPERELGRLSDRSGLGPTPVAQRRTQASPATSTHVEAELIRLACADTNSLARRWRVVFGHRAPDLPRALLQRILAYRIQADAAGDLDPTTIKLLDRLGRGEISEIPLPELRAIKPGTLLVREWEGTLQRVVVLESGFAWNGVTYESLSKVARAITGTNWNGPRFFGLRDRARAS